MKTLSLCEFFRVKEGQVFKIEGLNSVYYKIIHDKLLFSKTSDSFSWGTSPLCINETADKEIEIIKLLTKLTNAERVILENLNHRYNWVARDRSGELYVYYIRPSRNGGNTWKTLSRYQLLDFPSLFSFITWEDDEPYNIRELLTQ